MEVIGEIVLRLYSDELNYNRIGKCLSLQPTEIVRKNQNITSKLKTKYDIWLYEVEIHNNTNINEIISLFIHDIYKSNLKCLLKEERDVNASITINFRPDYNNMNYILNLSYQDILKLSELDVELNYDVIII